jgi:arylsulfatase A-like enzyme
MLRIFTARLFWSISIGLALAGVSTGLAARPGLPNVVIFLSDDQGWGDLSVNGNTNLQTPRIDSLAADGAILDRFYVSPVCSPTRAEMLTGRYHPRSGVYLTSKGGERVDLDEKTIAETFRRAGYATGAFGKWHNGTQYPYHPNARGFDEFYGFCSGHWAEYFNTELEHNGRLVQSKGYIIDDLTTHALRFIEGNRDEPFFCYLPYNTPHSPMQVPDRFYQRFDGVDVAKRHRDEAKENMLMTRAALAMCENIDWNVGRVLDKLADLELADNTIVVYFADNGPNSWRWNGGMKGRKGSTDEGGVRSPCLIRWPGHIQPGTKVTPIAAAIDLLPTLADLADIPVVSGGPLDGRSLKPLLLGSDEPWTERMIFSHWNKRVSVRTQQFRLDHQGRLFDMQRDPGQTQDVAEAHPKITQRLRQAVKEWSDAMLPGLTDDDRPFPVGYPQFPITLLPARDGITEGQVRRSNRFPNSTYFLDWTSVEDTITWDIEVATAGRYQVTMHYACPARDVGSTFELRFGEQRLRGQVNRAHDPPLFGPQHDRVPRIEGPMKNFIPMDVGILEMGKGRGPLTLQAVEIPGSQVMELRYLVLTLLP